MSTAALIGLAAFGVTLLLTLVIVARLHAFVALLVTSLVVAVVGGVPLEEVASQIQEQMGGTLGYISVVIGLGAMFGELLRRSGGAARIAERLLATFGDARAPWALTLTGLIVAIPVFFDVALILLIPLAYSLARRSGKSLLYYALPLLAGIAVAHAFIPPTPGPVAVAGLLGADLGWVILLGLVAGIPAALVGGIWFGRRVADRGHLEAPEFARVEVEGGAEGESERELGRAARKRPSFALAVGLITLPLALILLGTASASLLPAANAARPLLAFVGHPFTALVVATLLSFWLLGTRMGFSRSEVREMAGKSLEPVGMILLVTGAGGVFGKVLVATGVGTAAAEWMAGSRLPLVVLAFLIATVVRVAQGSATVSMVTAAALVAPIIEVGGLSQPRIAAVVIAIACGATVLSHVNDSGFWLVGRYLGVTEKQTLGIWTVLETVVGLTGFVVVLAISWFV